MKVKKKDQPKASFSEAFLDYIHQVKAPDVTNCEYVHGLDKPRNFSRMEISKQRKSNLAADCSRDRTSKNSSYSL
ncbi:MAG: hypothetical protein EKK54_06240 [Neisseriaceae bacterium]|nr:MAG: hypothetical protein EKK54_06240 [Neisseriaceae bacterium]